MKSQKPVIVGIDEAGRGALAGPVVAGAVVLTKGIEQHPLIKDSKQMTEQEREEAYQWIIAHCVYGVGIADASMIDSSGILSATEYAMQQAVSAVAEIITPTYLLIDGRDKFWFDFPHSAVVHGDETEPAISAGSIVAKVTRDRLMCEYAATFPFYGFAEHKGYGTPMHFQALAEHHPCPLHRSNFLRSHEHIINATTHIAIPDVPLQRKHQSVLLPAKHARQA